MCECVVVMIEFVFVRGGIRARGDRFDRVAGDARRGF